MIAWIASERKSWVNFNKNRLWQCDWTVRFFSLFICVIGICFIPFVPHFEFLFLLSCLAVVWLRTLSLILFSCDGKPFFSCAHFALARTRQKENWNKVSAGVENKKEIRMNERAERRGKKSTAAAESIWCKIKWELFANKLLVMDLLVRA